MPARVVTDPETSQSVSLPAYIFDAPTVNSDGTIYFGSGNGKFYAITPQGTQKWSFTTDTEIQSAAAIGTDGTIYFGCVNGKFYALNPDGSGKWELLTGDSILSSPAIATDGTLYFGSRDKKVYAVNPDGSLKWSFTTGRLVDSSPVIGIDGTIYVGSTDWNLYALRPDGTERWHLTYGSGPAGGMGVAVALASNGTIYAAVAGDQNRLYALSGDGTVLWQFPFGSLTAYVAPAAPIIGPDGTVYVGTPDRKFYAINPDGTKKWELSTGAAGHSAATIVGDGTIYFSTWDKEVFAVKPNGEVLWKYTASGPAVGGLFASVPTPTADGIFYVGSGNGHLYAFRASSSFSRAAWPMFGRNTKHSGNLATELLPRPVLSVVRRNDGSVRLRLWGERGVSLSLEASDRLHDWTTVHEFTGTGATIEWSDPAPLASARFYRLVQP